MSGALAWAVADPSNGGHSGFAQGHHRHRRSRRPSATCTGGGWRSGCPRISLGASWCQAAAYLTTFECDLGFCGGLGADLPSPRRSVVEEEGNWVLLLHHRHQGGLRPAGYARPVRRAARGCKKYLPAPPVRHQTPHPGSFWLCPRPPWSPEVSRAMIHPERWRVEVWTPSHQSRRIVAPSGSVLDHF